ncbi:lipid-binding protein [Proteiniphilum sp.]|uniref:lipid-binding protein n=1 Tax=Proteiniphilum sp. TaxID=1926877 RepID=UPI002B21D167|nr:lipid-binding protein [Proteiniphilum sp.]MEA4917137.1 lipid-binding protein [Proteiniphilum sp.]
MKKIIYLLGLITIGIFASCEREVNTSISDSTNSVNINLAGQWEVTAYNDTSTIFGPFKVITLQNPSAKNDSITIQDSEVKFWNFQIKASVNEKNGTFQTKLSTCEMSEDGIGVKISNGKIVNTDSIYFEIQFEDDETPYGNTYQLKGHRIS